MESKRLTDAQDIMAFIFAGNATFTVVGKKDRYTYKIKAGKTDGNNNIYFVKVLNGPNNETDYGYIGNIFGGQLRAGRKGKPDAPSFKALNWTISFLRNNPSDLGPLEVWHEGKCGRCGRKLTVPESVDQGYGPECINYIKG